MSKIVVPGEGRLYHGVHPGGGEGDEAEVNEKILNNYETRAGRKAAWVYFSHEWSESPVFPKETVRWIKEDRGAVPFIRLMLRSSAECEQVEARYTLEAIVAGDFDCELKDWGKNAATFGALICEWGTEVNDECFPWNAK